MVFFFNVSFTLQPSLKSVEHYPALLKTSVGHLTTLSVDQYPTIKVGQMKCPHLNNIKLEDWRFLRPQMCEMFSRVKV